MAWPNISLITHNYLFLLNYWEILIQSEFVRNLNGNLALRWAANYAIIGLFSPYWKLINLNMLYMMLMDIAFNSQYACVFNEYKSHHLLNCRWSKYVNFINQVFLQISKTNLIEEVKYLAFNEISYEDIGSLNLSARMVSKMKLGNE